MVRPRCRHSLTGARSCQNGSPKTEENARDSVAGQSTINFVKRSTRTQDNSVSQTVVSETQIDSESEEDIKSILKEVKTYLREIDTNIDSLASRLDRVSRKVDKHESKIADLETRVSDVEDSQTTVHTNLTLIQKNLAEIKAKNEDLEGRSRRNNVRILGVPESTNIHNMEQYVEGLFKELFGETYQPCSWLRGPIGHLGRDLSRGRHRDPS